MFERHSEPMPRGFHMLIAAQFTSAVADNALLIVTIAVLHAQGLPAWWAPMLKFGFTLAYVLLAPGVGDLADAYPKARLMAWMNGVKALGAMALLLSAHPVLAFCVVGLGAAAYAPAKYGLITELVPASRLVAANGWIEVSVVSAALFGTVLGGLMVSDLWLDSSFVQVAMPWVSLVPGVLGSPLAVSIGGLFAVYALAGLLNLYIPDSGARYAAAASHPIALVRAFRQANRTLWGDRAGSMSLAVTTLFWGVGATLQFIVLRWAEERLGLTLSQAAYMQVAVAVGMTSGAAVAGRLVPLSRARHMLAVGIVLGMMMPLAACVTSLAWAVFVLALTGMLSGLMIVPLNALLQHRGSLLMSAGRSIAVQGFNENTSVLVMLGFYAALVALDTPLVPLMWGFGLVISSAIAVITWRFRGLPSPQPA